MKTNHWRALAVAAVLLGALVRTARSGTTVVVDGKVTLLENKSYVMIFTDEIASAMIYRLTHDMQVQAAPTDQDEDGRPVTGLFAVHAGQVACYYKKNDSDGTPKNARCEVDLKLSVK